MHNVLFTWMSLVSFQLYYISQDLLINGTQNVLGSSQQPGNLRFGVRIALSTDRLDGCLHEKG